MSELHPAVASIIKDLKERGSDGLFAALDDNARALLDSATTLFEGFPIGAQVVSLAIMLGMLLASIDGEFTLAEAESKVLLTVEDRLALFLFQAKLVFNDSMVLREHPDCPGQDRLGKVM